MRLFITFIMVLFIGLSVQASELITYQGRLTDDTGEPVADGNYALTFSLWDDSTGGTMQWSETHASVPVTEGLFSVVLGKDGTLEASIFETEPLFLQIRLGYTDVIEPRTRLTSAPTAVAAKKVDGDVETGEGYLNLNAPDSSLAVSISTEGKGSPAYFRMYNPDPLFPEQMLVQLSSESSGGKFSMYQPEDVPRNPAFTIGLDPSPFYPGYMAFYNPGGDLPHDPYVKMGFDPTPFRGYLEFYDPGSGWADSPMIKMGVEPVPFHQGYIAMSNPEISPSPKLLDIGINDSTGEWESKIKMRLADQVEFSTPKDILTISAAPSTGASIKMATPLPEPPVTLVEMKVEEVVWPTLSYGSYFNMFSMDPGDDGRETFEISNRLTDGISLKMFNPQPEPPAVYFEVGADPTNGPSLGFFDDIGQVMGFDPTPFNQGFSMYLMDPSDEYNMFELTGNHVTNEVNMYLIDPVDKRDLLTMHSDPTNGASFRMFNPQPEPPARLFDLSVNIAKASDDVVMTLTSGDSLYQTKISPGRVKVGHPQIDTYPRSELNAGSDTVTFYLQGNTGLSPAPPIGMMSSNTEAKMGIGTLSPTEELHVVGDICYTGSIGTCSDLRYKKDIRTLGNALERVSRLRGVSFNWKRDEFPQRRFSDKNQVGLIAQEVKEVFPGVVSEDSDGYYNIDYTKLTPLLIEAIKELKQENEELKENNEDLVRRIEKLEAH